LNNVRITPGALADLDAIWDFMAIVESPNERSRDVDMAMLQPR